MLVNAGEELAARVWRARAWLLPAAALSLWLLFLAFLMPYNNDEAIYMIVVRDVVNGHWPYEHLFINRPPLLFLAYLPAGFTDSIEIQRLIAVAAMVASAPAFFVLARKHLTGRQVPLAVGSYCLLIGNPYMIVGANTESFLLLPLIAAMVVPSAVLAGALIGAAVMLKITVLPLVPAILLIRKTGLRVTLITAVAVCVALTVPFVPVWDDFWTANVTFAFDYADYSAPERLANTIAVHWGVLLGALPVWLAVVFGGLRERRWTLWLLFVGGVLAAKSTGFNATHYYALITPAAALFAGQGLDWLLHRPRLTRAIVVPATLICVSLVVLGLSLFTTSDHYRPYSDFVAEIDGRPGELYVLGDHAEIYAYAERQPERRYFFGVPLVFREDWGASTRAQLLACPPALLVLPTGNFFEVDWAEDVASVYGTRIEFKNASLLTDATHQCGAGEPASVRADQP